MGFCGRARKALIAGAVFSLAVALLAACSNAVVFAGDDFVFVEGGTFQMGSPDGAPYSRDHERPVRSVTVSSFWMSMHPVTQGEWYDLIGLNPSLFQGDRVPEGVNWRNLPVEQVSNWYLAVEFANRKSARAGLAPAYTIGGGGEAVVWNHGANGYRLPTEAEWEFAARGGIVCQENFIFSGSDIANEVAWFSGNSGWRTHEVGSLRPNALGLYDMSGNVQEWVWDWYGPYPDAPQTNPEGIAGPGFSRVLRGGNYMSAINNIRSATRALCETRERAYPECRFGPVGFRLVRSHVPD